MLECFWYGPSGRHVIMVLSLRPNWCVSTPPRRAPTSEPIGVKDPYQEVSSSSDKRPNVCMREDIEWDFEMSHLVYLTLKSSIENENRTKCTTCNSGMEGDEYPRTNPLARFAREAQRAAKAMGHVRPQFRFAPEGWNLPRLSIQGPPLTDPRRLAWGPRVNSLDLIAIHLSLQTDHYWLNLRGILLSR